MWHPFDAISFDRIIFSYPRCRYLLEVTDKLPVVYYDYKALVLQRRSVCFVPFAALYQYHDSKSPEPLLHVSASQRLIRRDSCPSE